MDRIYNILECHERWLEEMKPTEHDTKSIAEWDIILDHIEKNLLAHETLSNVMNMRNIEPEEIEREDRVRVARKMGVDI